MKVWRLPFKPVTNQPVTITARTFRELSEVRHLAVFTLSLVLRWVCRDDNKPLPRLLTRHLSSLFVVIPGVLGALVARCAELVWSSFGFVSWLKKATFFVLYTSTSDKYRW